MFVSQCWPGFSSLAVNCQVQSLAQAMMVVVEEQSVAVVTEYVSLLSQFLVQKSVMVGEKFNQLPKNVHGCTDALLNCGGGGRSR